MSLPISAIRRCVAEHFGITMEELLGPRLHRRVSRPRLVAYYLCRELTPYSLPRIGLSFGREHTTVLHGIVAIERAMKRDPALAAEVAACRAELRQAMGMNRISC